MIDPEWLTQTRRAAISVSDGSDRFPLGGQVPARHCGSRISGHAERPRALESIELRLPIQTTGTGAIAKVDSSLLDRP